MNKKKALVEFSKLVCGAFVPWPRMTRTHFQGFSRELANAKSFATKKYVAVAIDYQTQVIKLTLPKVEHKTKYTRLDIARGAEHTDKNSPANWNSK